jgi:hypothetical protein
MSRLRIYTIHIKPNLAQPYDEAEFVEEGFSWRAFIFSVFWLLYKRLWVPALILIAVNATLVGFEEMKILHATSIAILQLGIGMVVGYHGNDWYRARLKSKGYILADIVSGENLLRAEQRFYDRFAASGRQSSSLSHSV